MKLKLVLAVLLTSVTALSDSQLTSNAKEKLAKDAARKRISDKNKGVKTPVTQHYLSGSKQGDVGYFYGNQVLIKQVLSEDSALVGFYWKKVPWNPVESDAILEGVSMYGIADDMYLNLKRQYVQAGTKSFMTVLGAKRTVVVFRPHITPRKTSETTDTQVTQPSSSDLTETEVKYETCILLEQLMGFKDSASFKKYGFAIAGPHNEWLEDVQKLRTKASGKGDINILVRAAPTHLLSIGMAFLSNQDSRFLQNILPEIKQTILYEDYLKYKTDISKVDHQTTQ